MRRMKLTERLLCTSKKARFKNGPPPPPHGWYHGSHRRFAPVLAWFRRCEPWGVVGFGGGLKSPSLTGKSPSLDGRSNPRSRLRPSLDFVSSPLIDFALIAKCSHGLKTTCLSYRTDARLRA